MNKENILKEKLIKIKNKNYLLEKEENYFDFGLEMMENLGSIDPILRDELIYGILLKWCSDNRFTFEQLNGLLDISLDKEHLFYKLYDKDDDAVFKRTFSLLIIALIIYEHRKENFLSDKELYKVKNKLLEYMINEQDLRGFVEIKGWAHSAAHAADALDELAQCNCFNKTDFSEILNSIKVKVCVAYYVYVDEESERMVTTVVNVFNKNILSNSEIIEWILGFKVENSKWNRIEKLHLKVNVKGFLRSLYFRLLDKGNSKVIVQEIKKILDDLQ